MSCGFQWIRFQHTNLLSVFKYTKSLPLRPLPLLSNSFPNGKSIPIFQILVHLASPQRSLLWFFYLKQANSESLYPTHQWISFTALNTFCLSIVDLFVASFIVFFLIFINIFYSLNVKQSIVVKFFKKFVIFREVFSRKFGYFPHFISSRQTPVTLKFGTPKF